MSALQQEQAGACSETERAERWTVLPPRETWPAGTKRARLHGRYAVFEVGPVEQRQ